MIKTKIKIPIVWTARYSETMDDDKHGRWARVGYAGKLHGFPFINDTSAIFEIAWIKKVKDEKTGKTLGFQVISKFPNDRDLGKVRFGDGALEEAQLMVENGFNFFMNTCIQHRRKSRKHIKKIANDKVCQKNSAKNQK